MRNAPRKLSVLETSPPTIHISNDFASSASAQGITFFFAAGDLSGEPDRFGNKHTIAPSDLGDDPEEPITLDDVIEPLPFGHDDLFDVAVEEDNK